MAYVVHHLDQSRSHRLLWLLEELGADYEIVSYKRNAEMRAPAELRKIHPLGKSPVLQDGSTVVAESAAIMEYVIDRHGGRLRPEDGDALQRYRFFMHYAEGSLMPPLLVKLITGKIRSGPIPFFIKPIAKAIAAKVDESFTNPELDNHIRFLEGELEGREWFVGDELTAADIMMSFALEAAASRGALSAEHPRLQKWLASCQARPAYNKAVEVGGPYSILTDG